MAKKPSQEPKLKTELRKIIKKEGELINESKDPKIEFGFVFSFPKGRDPKTKEPINPPFSITKSKEQEFVYISTRLDFNVDNISKLKLKKKFKLFMLNIRRICLLKNVDYKIYDEKNILIHDRLSYNAKGLISHFEFFSKIRNLYFIGLYMMSLIEEYIGEAMDSGYSSPYHI